MQINAWFYDTFERIAFYQEKSNNPDIALTKTLHIVGGTQITPQALIDLLQNADSVIVHQVDQNEEQWYTGSDGLAIIYNKTEEELDQERAELGEEYNQKITHWVKEVQKRNKNEETGEQVRYLAEKFNLQHLFND